MHPYLLLNNNFEQHTRWLRDLVQGKVRSICAGWPLRDELSLTLALAFSLSFFHIPSFLIDFPFPASYITSFHPREFICVLFFFFFPAAHTHAFP
ncbi:hypothetical protein VTP01DRAFT_7768 [Rhizomucor pusillus]|uniref:uncharacterized protein n=1 Tax=Rhizomucor pusillus TaxID=4840 RepID=UPI0037449635